MVITPAILCNHTNSEQGWPTMVIPVFLVSIHKSVQSSGVLKVAGGLTFFFKYIYNQCF